MYSEHAFPEVCEIALRKVQQTFASIYPAPATDQTVRTNSAVPYIVGSKQPPQVHTPLSKLSTGL